MTTDTIRCWVEVSLDAFAKNFKLAQELTGKKVMCVIKGNAHGHGALKSGLHLEKNGADAFAVACFTEAVELREGGITKPILILGWTPAECAEQMADYNLTQSVFDEQYAIELNAILNLEKLDKKITGAIISSVVPELTRIFKNAYIKIFDKVNYNVTISNS